MRRLSLADPVAREQLGSRKAHLHRWIKVQTMGFEQSIQRKIKCQISIESGSSPRVAEKIYACQAQK